MATQMQPIEPISEHEHASGGARRGSSRLVITLVVIAALVAGLLAGAHWQERIRGLMGHEHAASAVPGAPKQLWTCGMHPQVIQDKPGNCPICGMALEPLNTQGMDASAKDAGERKIKYWWDPMMNPPYITSKPGKSPMGMDLVPVYEDEVSAGTVITIDPAVVQNMGVRVARVSEGPIDRTLRAVGYLQIAQPRIYDINLRVSGWVEKLYADTEGMLVEKGQPLFELYSPEVQVAVEELITARRALESMPQEADETARKTADLMVGIGRRKLGQWGLGQLQIEELAKLETAPRTISFLSPVTGEVAEKMVVQGAMVKMGERALRLTDRSVLWLDAQIYAQDMPFIKLGQKVAATIEAMPEQQFEGELIFVNPQVDPMTRTATVRVALDNPKLTLRPGMFATASITAQLVDKALLIPREAILDTGTRQVVFVAMSGGHFEPRKVKTGSSSDDGSVQVLSGLVPGELVVTSGQFLMDSESRMKEAIQKHLSRGLLAANGQKVSAAAVEQPGAVTTDAHAGHAMPATTPASRAATSPAWNAAVDQAIAEYLKLSETLGAVQMSATPLDSAGLLAAADALAQAAADENQKSLSKYVAEGAKVLAGKTLAEQRESFKSISDVAIELVSATPAAQKLYVLYCPMAKGSWLQQTEVRANPYYATDMKECAVVKREIAKR